MSQMIGMPPRQIQLPGGPQGGPPGGAPGAGAPDAVGGGAPDPGQVNALLKQARALVFKAATLEGDDADAAQLHKIAADLSAVLGNAQKLNDSAMGAGPGVKLVRKVGGGV